MSNPQHGSFPDTRWSLVQRAVINGDDNAFDDFSKLCEIYYEPLLALIPFQKDSLEDKKDLLHRFFIHLRSREKFNRALGAGVMLRAFLRTELKGFLIDQYRYSTAAKRDFRKNNSLDDPDHPQPESSELINWTTPDLEYDRKWRIALVKHCMKAVGKAWEEKRTSGKNLPPFREIGPLLTQKSDETQRALAARLRINENTLKTHLSTLRVEFAKQVHFQVAQTLANPSQEAIQAEISSLQVMK